MQGPDLELVRLWSGLVMTSLDMAGISVTLLALPAGAVGEDMLALLDAPTGARAWPGGGRGAAAAAGGRPADGAARRGGGGG